MGKIVRLQTVEERESHMTQAAVIKVLEDLLARAKAGEFDRMIIAAKLMNGDVATSWANADAGERMELIGHLQADVMLAVVQRNLF